MREPSTQREVQAQAEERARVSQPLLPEKECEGFLCSRTIRDSETYCHECRPTNPLVGRNPITNVEVDDILERPTVPVDPPESQLDRVEKKLDALLDHLGVEVED